MPIAKIALILGAGFSTEAGLPTTYQLGEGFLDPILNSDLPQIVEQEISQQLAQFWKVTFGYKENQPHPSLEDHFTVIDLAANTGHHIGPIYSPRKLRAIRRLSIHRAFQILNSSYRNSPSIEQLFRTVSAQEDFSIVSVNWDIVAEKHLAEIGLAYNYGPVVEFLPPLMHQDAQVPVLKLHGSTNWTYCDSCRTLFAAPTQDGKDALHRLVFIEADDFKSLESDRRVSSAVTRLPDYRQCIHCNCDLTARVGTFSFRKDFAIQQFQTIWQRAHNELRESSAWLFVGYSMPESDFEFRHLLKSAQMAGRPIPNREIQVVLKGDAEAALRFRRFFGLRNQQVDQRGAAFWVQNCMNAWLAALPGAF